MNIESPTAMDESYASCFATSYSDARRRFREAAARVGAAITSYPLPIGGGGGGEDELAIDVATLGPESAPTIVTSSGVHGVEGFMGSAAQCAFLKRLDLPDSRLDVRHVLIHAVNPFGFARLRRFNEDNVDLNRNFLFGDQTYRGVSEGYARLNRFLNPESPPSRIEFFRVKAAWNLWRYGRQTLKQSIAGGQYEFPRGVFYGGKTPCASTRIVQENCAAWLGTSEPVVHIDFHTGLGRFGTYKLLLIDDVNASSFAWYARTFGADCVEPLDAPEATAYRVSGMLGAWMQDHFASRKYRFVAAEFGTYDAVRVLSALRAENRAYHHGEEGREEDVACNPARAELLECFCPADPTWRKQVVAASLRIIDQAIAALGTDD